jgi:uncharacterized membrane protein/membrane-bound inhibitor of C-type lysozyme
MVTLAALVGLALFSVAPVTPERTTWAYDCEGLYVVAHYGKAGELTLFLPDRTLFLPAQPAGSGAKYGADGLSFWSKGGSEALLEQPGEPRRRCTVDGRSSVREDAKLRGVDFRATGNEPGWVLELGPDAFRLYYDYGKSLAAFPLLEPKSDAGKRETAYMGETESHRIEIVIRGVECQDTMADDRFESTVTVTLDGRELRGCGQALH